MNLFFTDKQYGNFYRPQTKLRKGNALTPVCQSFCSDGGCLPQCMLGYTPWADTPPGQTPPGRHPPGRYPPGQTPLQTPPADGTHPIGMHSCFSFKYVILIIFAVILIVKHMNSKLPNRLLKACRLVFFVRSKTE